MLFSTYYNFEIVSRFSIINKTQTGKSKIPRALNHPEKNGQGLPTLPGVGALPTLPGALPVLQVGDSCNVPNGRSVGWTHVFVQYPP